MTSNRRGRFRKRIAFVLIGFGLAGLCAWTLFGRRESALERWMIEMRAKGEKLTLEELGLNRAPGTNAALDIIESAASRFKAFERVKIAANWQSSEEIGSARKRVSWAGTNLHSIMGR